MNSNNHISESIRFGMLLALSGGFMDAYSYLFRGHVFANAQTGNILLLGVHLSEGRWHMALRSLVPIVSFVLGIALADHMSFRIRTGNTHSWKRRTILFEAIALFVVGWIPQSYNWLANALTSFACGLQVETVRVIRGNTVATTMCIGNLRSAVQSIVSYRFTKDLEQAKRGLLYLLIILCFVFGAVLGNACIHIFAQRSIWICSSIVMFAYLFLLLEGEKSKM